MKMRFKVLFLILISFAIIGCIYTFIQNIILKDNIGRNTIQNEENVIKDNNVVSLSNYKNGVVIYYSWSGNTKHVAERIAKLTNSDIYEISTVKSYPTDEHETATISIEEQNSDNSPEIVNNIPELNKYEVIYLGGAIWNSYMQTPLERYAEDTDFTNKIIMPFITSQGSSSETYISDLRNRAKNVKEIKKDINIVFSGNS